MGFDKIKLRQIRNMIIFIAAIILGLMYSEVIFEKIGVFFTIMSPFIIGGIIAFVLNLPLRTIENKILKKWDGKVAKRIKRPVSIFLSILFVILILVVVGWSVVPQLGKTVIELSKTIPPYMDKLMDELEKLSANYPKLQEYVYQLKIKEPDWDKLLSNVIDFMQNGMTDVLSSTVSVASQIAGGFLNSFIGFIFAMYILGQKEILQCQFKKIMQAYLSYRANQKALKVFELLHMTFSNFVTGQCLEAVILGSMFVVTMLILKIPYAFMIGVLIALTALIPIVGAFIGFFVGAFMIVMVDPIKALIFMGLFLLLQQIEENLIYPRVVGDKVGLPPIWVLMAVTVGGSLFGVGGMLFFIPLTSTLYMLIKDSVNTRLQKKPVYNNRRNNNNKNKKNNTADNNTNKNDK